MNKVRTFSMVILLLVISAVPVLAEEAFHLNFRQVDMASDGSVLTGNLLLNVLNISGVEAKDLEAWIEGPNGVTFNSNRIFLGTLSDGEQVEVFESIQAPADMVVDTRDQVVWTLEYTDSDGNRVSVRVTGQNVH